MLELASARVPDAGFVQSDALRLPFADGTFDRVFTSHFYGHLEEAERVRFLAEARRVAPELVVVDSALRDDVRAGRVAGADPERRLALAGLQALLHPGRARDRARRRRDALRRPLVRGRAVRAMTTVVPFLRVADAEASAEWYARLGFGDRVAPSLRAGLAALHRDLERSRADLPLRAHRRRAGRTRSSTSTSTTWTRWRPSSAPWSSSLRTTFARSSSATRTATASGSARPSPSDRPQELVPLARLAPARQRALPRLPRGRLSARVLAGAGALPRPARVPLRPGARDRRGRGAAAVARPRRPAAARLARARGRRAVRDVLLRLGDALLPRPSRVRPRRPDADAARAGPLRVLARLGARAAATGPDRHRRRAGAAAAARRRDPDRGDRQELHARRRDRDPAAAPLRRQRLAQRPGEPGAPRQGADARAARARAARLGRREHSIGERRPVPPHVRPPARLPAPVQGLADRLDDPRRPLAGGGDRDRAARRRGDRGDRGAARHRHARLGRSRRSWSSA